MHIYLLVVLSWHDQSSRNFLTLISFFYVHVNLRGQSDKYYKMTNNVGKISFKFDTLGLSILSSAEKAGTEINEVNFDK